MKRTAVELRKDALAIWQAGVDAVRGDRLISDNVRVEGSWLSIADEQLSLDKINRIVVVGAGKAGASMASGLESALGQQWMEKKHLTGWINVPADCMKPLKRIQLHAARNAGVNEPSQQGVAGAKRIVELVESLGPQDLCLCLISGGGSALLPAPVEGITLADKLAVTKHLSAAGANIQQLNTVRKQLSRIKGGGLARSCPSGRLIALIISDVIGDPLDIIASGPTVEDPSSAQDALNLLEQFESRQAGISPSVFSFLQQRAKEQIEQPATQPSCNVTNIVIGNNAVAVDAAGIEAQRRGYRHAIIAAGALEGPAEDVGRHLAEMALHMRDEPGPDCFISGGEPIVRLVEEEKRGLGGRNQQLVLAALEKFLGENQNQNQNPLDGIVLLSGGTDGEDGPTDAAGAIIDESICSLMKDRNRSASEYLLRNDAYHFFQPLKGLIKTGPTHTNVCDVRVALVDRIEAEGRGK